MAEVFFWRGLFTKDPKNLAAGRNQCLCRTEIRGSDAPPPIPLFLPVMRVQSRGSRKKFSHSWSVAYSSNIPHVVAVV